MRGAVAAKRLERGVTRLFRSRLSEGGVLIVTAVVATVVAVAAFFCFISENRDGTDCVVTRDEDGVVIFWFGFGSVRSDETELLVCVSPSRVETRRVVIWKEFQ